MDGAAGAGAGAAVTRAARQARRARGVGEGCMVVFEWLEFDRVDGMESYNTKSVSSGRFEGDVSYFLYLISHLTSHISYTLP